jgi:hypothetical protein
MFPAWLTHPDRPFEIVLFLLSPLWIWLAGKVVHHVSAWQAARSESTARVMLAYLYKALDSPPTLLESLAYIVCFLPIPIFLLAGGFTLYFAPPSPWGALLGPDVAEQVHRTIALVLSSVCYSLFGVLTVHGIKTAYHLRDGQLQYHANYRAGMHKRIDKLLKKFPQLRSVPPNSG